MIRPNCIVFLHNNVLFDGYTPCRNYKPNAVKHAKNKKVIKRGYIDRNKMAAVCPCDVYNDECMSIK